MKDSTLTTRKATKPRRHPPKGFDYGTVPTADRIALQGHEAEFTSVARKDIAEIFAHAERLIDAKERLPKRYAEWVKKACKGISIRTAGNYTSTYERFHDRIEEIVALDILPTHLYRMTNAPEPAIEEIFGRAEAGETVTGADVTRIILLHKDPSEPATLPKVDQPMKKGLLAFIKPPTDEAVDTWFLLLEELHSLIVAALPDGVTKTKLLKGELKLAVSHRAGWLRGELIRLTSLDPYRTETVSYGEFPKPFWPSGRWKEVEKALRGVAGVGQVNFRDLEDELRLKLIPPIEWALGRIAVDPEGEIAKQADGAAPDEVDTDGTDEDDGGAMGRGDAPASSAAS